MTRTTLACFSAAVVLALLAGAARADDTVCKLHAQNLLKNLGSGHYIDATADFDATMKSAMTPAALRSTWSELTRKYGDAKPAGAAEIQHQGTYTIVTIPMGFKSGALAAQIACDADDAIAGLHLVPANAP